MRQVMPVEHAIISLCTIPSQEALALVTLGRAYSPYLPRARALVSCTRVSYGLPAQLAEISAADMPVPALRQRTAESLPRVAGGQLCGAFSVDAHCKLHQWTANRRPNRHDRSRLQGQDH